MSKMNNTGICARLLQPAAKLLGSAGALAVLAGVAPGFAMSEWPERVLRNKAPLPGVLSP